MSTCRETVNATSEGLIDGLNTVNPEILEAAKKLGESALKTGENIQKAVEALAKGAPQILDSGDRTEFATGAVRDMREGKGRCDLMPLEVVAHLYPSEHGGIFTDLAEFKKTNDTDYLYDALCKFASIAYDRSITTQFLEVAKHFEDGAKKYGENNWQKGIPTKCYIDSAIRHYFKWYRGDKDEPHDRAFVWNLMCCIWEVDYREKEEKNVDSSYFLTPEDGVVSLKECPVGLFEYNGELCVKTEYMTQISDGNYKIDAYIVSTGERFCVDNALVKPCGVWVADGGDE